MVISVSKILKSRGAKKESIDLSISSGRYLESVRRLKGITLEEVSEKTKIKIRYLRALEEEEYDSLPPGAYRRYILKALAEAIDLDPEAVADDFQKRVTR
jgi:cytoskeletal protein RodZ